MIYALMSDFEFLLQSLSRKESRWHIDNGLGRELIPLSSRLCQALQILVL